MRRREWNPEDAAGNDAATGNSLEKLFVMGDGVAGGRMCFPLCHPRAKRRVPYRFSSRWQFKRGAKSFFGHVIPFLGPYAKLLV